MIHANRIVTVGEQECIIDRPIVLYRGDREVEIEFTLVGNEFTFSEDGNVIKSVNASHGQLVLNTPSGEHMFSELAECHEGKVVFVVTKEMIDEFIEMGFYSFQIRLYDGAEMKSRVTIPPIFNGFDIRNPIAAEDEANVVDQGIVDYARISKDQSDEELPTFDWQGNYNKTEWAHHDVITENKMNKIEDALYSINANVKESDVVMLNALDNVKKDADAYVKEHMAEVEADVEEFERNLNTDVERFKIDTNAAMTTHKNEVSEVVESVNTQLAHIENETEYINVKRFGAKGDGLADDTNSIQNALEYCFENKRNLYFEDGEYITTKPLYFYVADNSFEPSVNIKGQSHHGVKINKINNKKDDVFGINSIIIVVNGEFKRNNNVNIEGKFARNFEIKNMSFIGDSQADYGLYFPFTCVSSTLKNINITKVNEAGVKYKQGIYLCDLDRVRIQHSKKGFDLSEGLNTSLNIANCYCTNISEVAYDLKGSYSNLYNCCADGCEGSVFKFRYFIGSVNGCGAESRQASKIFDIVESNNITLNGLYTWGNYDNAEATHIHIRGESKAIFNNCRMMVRGNNINSVALGTVYESGENCYLEFNSCEFGEYTNFTNSTQSAKTTVKISNLNGRLQYRENSMPSIGFDNYNETEINPLGSAIFTGLSDNHYTYVNGDNLDYKKPTSQGDIILTKNVYGTGCIGWVNAFDRKEDIYFKGTITNIEGNVIELDDIQLDIEGSNNIVINEWTTLKSSSGGWCSIRKTDLKEKTITVSDIGGAWNVGDRIFVPKGNNKSSQTLKIPVVISCMSNNRPNKSLQKGQSVFDENLGKPIWYNGTSWVDSTGAPV